MAFFIPEKYRNHALEDALMKADLPLHLKLSFAECEARKSGTGKQVYNGLIFDEKFTDREKALSKIRLIDNNGFLTKDFAAIVAKYDAVNHFSYVNLLTNNTGNCSVCAFLAEELYYDITGKHLDILWLDQPNSNDDHAVLLDKKLGCTYSFAVDPFITKNVSVLPKHDLMTEVMIIQYCYLIGKTN